MPAILTIGPHITMMSASGFSLINVVMNYASGQGELSQFLISIGSVGIMMVGSALWPTLTRVFSNKRIKKREKKGKKKKIRRIFFIYSFLGWLMESVGDSIKKKKFINKEPDFRSSRILWRGADTPAIHAN